MDGGASYAKSCLAAHGILGGLDHGGDQSLYKRLIEHRDPFSTLNRHTARSL